MFPRGGADLSGPPPISNDSPRFYTNLQAEKPLKTDFDDAARLHWCRIFRFLLLIIRDVPLMRGIRSLAQHERPHSYPSARPMNVALEKLVFKDRRSRFKW